MSYEILRLIFGFGVGVLLYQSGSVLQHSSQNNLASTSTLGLSAISVGWALVLSVMNMTFGLDISLKYVGLFLVAMTFGIYFFWRVDYQAGNRYRPLFDRFILLGMSINLLVAAVISVVEFLFLAQGKTLPGHLWFGTVKFLEMQDLTTFFAPACMLMAWAFFLSKKLSHLKLGHDYALGRGINVRKMEFEAVFFSLAASILVVAHYGVFAFLGLIAPVIMRTFPIFQKNTVLEINIGAFATGIVMCGIDYLCYQYPVYGAELPVGLLTSIFGPIILIAILVKKRSRLY
jgi:iron complex transport system permease protein